MQTAFKVQQELKASLGLKKIAVHINDKYKPNGPKSYAKTLRKFGIKPTLPCPFTGVAQCSVVKQGEQLLTGQAPTVGLGSRDLSKNQDDGTGKDPAQDEQNDMLYLAEVDIGTPAQKLMLDFDTGSADLWVFSTELPSSYQKNHGVFDPSKSKSFKTSDGLNWKISYGDGSSASSDVGTDVVSVGGLSIQGQSVELAKQLSSEFAQGSGDGLLGLAWSTINTITKHHIPNPQKTPIENLISSGTLPKEAQLFTSCFYSSRDANQQSFYTFGYIDQDLIKSSGKDIVWADVDNSQGFWTISSETASINNQHVRRSGNTAIADTGTTLALLGDDIVKALYKSIPGSKYDESQGGYMIPDSTTVDQLPDFSVAIGSTQFVIQKEDLVFGEPTDGYWYGGVQSRGENPFDILGDVFLKSIYAIWDQGGVRFGAVPKIQANQNLGGPSNE